MTFAYINKYYFQKFNVIDGKIINIYDGKSFILILIYFLIYFFIMFRHIILPILMIRFY
jgi:hypothetical protein